MTDEHGDSTSFKQKRSQHGRKLNLEVEELRWPTGPFQAAGTVPFFALKVLLWGDVCPEQTRMVCHLNSEPRRGTQTRMWTAGNGENTDTVSEH